VDIDRVFYGVRLDAQRTLGTQVGDIRRLRAPQVNVGLDAQRMRDERRNYRSTGGARRTATDTLLLDQVESVSSIGPFAMVAWWPMTSLRTSAGVRWDRQQFQVRDRYTGDGDDNSGERTMSAGSAHIGASLSWRSWLVPYASVASAFETPTTTELNARSDGSGGFNSALGPQRILTYELGARGRLFGVGERARVGYELAVFTSRSTDAIIQYQEVQGRAYFRNAGRTASRGAEIGLDARVARWLDARLAYTHAHYVFDTYRVPRVGAVDTLDGNRMAGVPEQFVRAGLRARAIGATFDADWTWSDRLWADDANTLRISDWGPGRLDVRIAWDARVAGNAITPFFAVNNAFNQRYVGSVTLNGAFGRVREPAPRRHWYAGFEFNWSVIP
jgi:iron complex outermembrane receptor protein